jgi:hypothetical protein
LHRCLLYDHGIGTVVYVWGTGGTGRQCDSQHNFFFLCFNFVMMLYRNHMILAGVTLQVHDLHTLSPPPPPHFTTTLLQLFVKKKKESSFILNYSSSATNDLLFTC